MKIDFLTKPELLAPAGSFDCLKAAVQNGADAVYVGLKTGSARMGAENFSIEELKEAVAYAHIRGVRVFLAFNTIFFEDEFQQAYNLAKEAAKTGIDALIVQDLGLASRILANKDEFGCEIHASTQMSVYNKEGVQLLKKLGFDRCITARELSVNEISELCKENLLEIEVFCHGALCMSVSGQCLMSSFIGGRSGNRGTCAQPCRQKYALSANGNVSAPAYRLSPADFASLPHLEELIKAGVHSLKIEGRLKSPAYVAAVTRSYRETIDSLCEGKTIDISKKTRDMQVLFGRGDFTSGYLKGKLPFKDITFRSAGRVGLPIGTVKSGPGLLPSPKNLPNKLVRFFIEVNTNYNLNIGDGITVYTSDSNEQKTICGGTVNAIEKKQSSNLTRITLVGNIFSKAQSNAPYVLTLTDDSSLRKNIEANTKTESRRSPVCMRFGGNRGDLPIVEIFDNQGNICQETGTEQLQIAQKSPTTADEIKKQLSKLGDTPFYAEEVSVSIDSDIFIPVSILNAMRRNAVAKLIEARKNKKHITGAAQSVPKLFTQNQISGGISLFFYTIAGFLQFEESKLPKILQPYKNENRTYYIPMAGFAQALDKIRKIKSSGKNKIIVYFPHISLGKALENSQKIVTDIYNNYLGTYIDGFMCENLGDFSTLRANCKDDKPDAYVCCDYSFNIANTHSLAALSDIGVSRATLSVEATDKSPESHTEKPDINTEVVVGGPIVLMRSRHCYIDEGECGGKCSKCTKAAYSLKDSKGGEFPILAQKDDCCSILLSHRDIPYSDAQIKKLRSENPNVTLRVNIL